MRVTEDKSFMYVSDDNFAGVLGVSMMSLLKHNPGSTIYVLSDHISAENIAKLQQITDEANGILRIIDLPEIYQENAVQNRKWPALVFARLYAGDFLPKDLDKVLYLDCDVLIRGNLDAFWSTDLNGFVCAGVKDPISHNFQRNIGLRKKDIYVNAGVILFNLTELRKLAIHQMIHDFMKHYLHRMSYGDQDAINAMFAGRIRTVPMRYNVMSLVLEYNYQELKVFRHVYNYYPEVVYETERQNPVIVHFTGHFWNKRPWEPGCTHPYVGEYLAYKDQSPWREVSAEDQYPCTMQDKALRWYQMLNRKTAIVLCGIVHADMYPIYKRIRSILKERKK